MSAAKRADDAWVLSLETMETIYTAALLIFTVFAVGYTLYLINTDPPQ